MSAHVIIVGAGFGGVYTARKLLPLVRSKHIKLTIINRTNYFVLTPLLHEVATGGLSPYSVVEPLRTIFAGEDVHIVETEVAGVNSIAKVVETRIGNFSYDYCVVSVGAETQFYGTPGAEQFGLTLKGLEDAINIRSAIIDQCEKAAQSHNHASRAAHLSFAIIGGGPTGVEMAGELSDFVRETLCAYYKNTGIAKDQVTISLVSAAPDLLAQCAPSVRKAALVRLQDKGVNVYLGTTVTNVTHDHVEFGNGTAIHSAVTLWVAGVKPVKMHIEGAQFAKSGRILIKPTLEVDGIYDVFALGDVAGTEKPDPMMAQVAVRQAATIAYNIKDLVMKNAHTLHPDMRKTLKTDFKDFKFSSPGVLVSLGTYEAVGQIMGITISGFIAWIIWRTVYLFKFASLRKRLRIGAEWALDFLYPRDITRVRMTR